LRDEEFTKKLFGDLNRDILGPPNNDKIIILSDYDEEKEEVREEKTIGTETVATSAAVNLASTASADDAPTGVKNNNSDDRTPDLKEVEKKSIYNFMYSDCITLEKKLSILIFLYLLQNHYSSLFYNRTKTIHFV
jgi:hypothetical protein